MRIDVISIGCYFVGCQNFQFGRTIRFREKRPLLPEGRAGAGRGRRERRSPRCLAQRVDKQRFVPIGTRCYEPGRDARSWRKERGAEALLGLRLRTLTTFERHLALRPDLVSKGDTAFQPSADAAMNLR